jgi:hypothetical protein
MLPDTWVAIMCIGIVIFITVLLKCFGFWAGIYSRYHERNHLGAEGRDTEQYAEEYRPVGDLAYCIACTVPCNTCCGSTNKHEIVV